MIIGLGFVCAICRLDRGSVDRWKFRKLDELDDAAVEEETDPHDEADNEAERRPDDGVQRLLTGRPLQDHRPRTVGGDGRCDVDEALVGLADLTPQDLESLRFLDAPVFVATLVQSALQRKRR